MIIPFSDWTPDSASLGGGSMVANNALPAQRGYQSFSQLSIVSDAIDARPRGAIEAFDKDKVSHQYVGNASKIYTLDPSDLTWTDASIGGGYSTATDEIWSMVRWKNKVLAVNFSDNPQQITMGGANFSNLTTAFKARNITVVGDFVVTSNTYDATDGNVPNRVRWSGIDDETAWTVSPSTLSDFRDLPVGGAIQKITGGDVGIIVSERSVFRMEYVGAPVVFRIDEILPDIGAVSSGSVTNIGDNVYFISQQGFIELTGNGTGVNRIGAGKVDQTFLADVDPEYYGRISSMADPTGNRIFWAYPGAGSVSGRPNKIIVYDRAFDKWSLIEEEVELLVRSRGVEFTLEELDGLGYTNIDTMDISLDSGVFKQASSQVGAFDESFKLGFFRGPNKSATLQTAELALNSGSQTMLNSFTPLVDRGTVTARISTRDTQSDEPSFGLVLSQGVDGKIYTRSLANFHSIELTITGEMWADALGVDIGSMDARRTGMRGKSA